MFRVKILDSLLRIMVAIRKKSWEKSKTKKLAEIIDLSKIKKQHIF